MSDPRSSSWGVHRLGQEGEADVRLGPLELRLRAHRGELRMAARRESGGPGRAAPEEWSRWATREWDGEVELAPSFPERTVVLEPDDRLRLLEGAEARVYVRVPLRVDVRIRSGAAVVTLARLTTVSLSDTWWGSSSEGELCHHLGTSARREVSDDLFAEHLAVCPLHLVNQSYGELGVDKIALRVAYLSIFRRGPRTWSDEIRVAYAGEAEGTRLEMSGRPPAEEPAAELVTPARETMARGLRARTFERLRTLQAGW